MEKVSAGFFFFGKFRKVGKKYKLFLKTSPENFDLYRSPTNRAPNRFAEMCTGVITCARLLRARRSKGCFLSAAVYFSIASSGWFAFISSFPSFRNWFDSFSTSNKSSTRRRPSENRCDGALVAVGRSRDFACSYCKLGGDACGREMLLQVATVLVVGVSRSLVIILEKSLG